MKITPVIILISVSFLVFAFISCISKHHDAIACMFVSLFALIIAIKK